MNPDYKHRHHHVSFKSALNGILLVIKMEINMKIIIAASALVAILGFIFKITYYEWLIVVLVTGLVYFAEMVNTSIEAVTDLVTTEWKEDAKIAKDVASGMVLVSSIIALVIGLMIFAPKIKYNLF